MSFSNSKVKFMTGARKESINGLALYPESTPSLKTETQEIIE